MRRACGVGITENGTGKWVHTQKSAFGMERRGGCLVSANWIDSPARGDEMRITGGELLNNGWWLKYCELTGTNEWCMNEGLASSDTEFELTIEQAAEIGIVRLSI